MCCSCETQTEEDKSSLTRFAVEELRMKEIFFISWPEEITWIALAFQGRSFVCVCMCACTHVQCASLLCVLYICDLCVFYVYMVCGMCVMCMWNILCYVLYVQYAYPLCIIFVM